MNDHAYQPWDYANRDVSMSQSLWPGFMDGEGNLHATLPWLDEYTLPGMLVRTPHPSDAGILYNVRFCDLDGDGLDEILIYNRERFWHYRCG